MPFPGWLIPFCGATSLLPCRNRPDMQLPLRCSSGCVGEDLTGGVFVPVASKRYALLFFYDGTAVRGIVQSVAA